MTNWLRTILLKRNLRKILKIMQSPEGEAWYNDQWDSNQVNK